MDSRNLYDGVAMFADFTIHEAACLLAEIEPFFRSNARLNQQVQPAYVEALNRIIKAVNTTPDICINIAVFEELKDGHYHRVWNELGDEVAVLHRPSKVSRRTKLPVALEDLDIERSHLCRWRFTQWAETICPKHPFVKALRQALGFEGCEKPVSEVPTPRQDLGTMLLDIQDHGALFSFADKSNRFYSGYLAATLEAALWRNNMYTCAPKSQQRQLLIKRLTDTAAYFGLLNSDGTICTETIKRCAEIANSSEDKDLQEPEERLATLFDTEQKKRLLLPLASDPNRQLTTYADLNSERPHKRKDYGLSNQLIATMVLHQHAISKTCANGNIRQFKKYCTEMASSKGFAESFGMMNGNKPSNKAIENSTLVANIDSNRNPFKQ